MFDRDWTTNLPTWPLPHLEFLDSAKEFDAPRRRPRAEAPIAAAVAIGLVLGGLAWAWWQRRACAAVSIVAHAPAPVAVTTPAPAPVWMPQTRADIERMVRGVGAWIRLAPQTDDHALARMLWAAHWGDVPFPRPGPTDARPGVGEALDLVFGVIASARAEDIQATAANEPVSSDEPTEEPDAIAASVCDSPTPGSFYRVRHGDHLLGEAGIAARALRTAVLDAAQRRGQAAEKAQGRATRLASDPRAQAIYADLIQRGAWNAQHGDELVEGLLLWLPPLHRVRLHDRSRQRRIRLDPQPWPDGSTKLEPPPMVRKSKYSPASAAHRSFASSSDFGAGLASGFASNRSPTARESSIFDFHGTTSLRAPNSSTAIIRFK